MPSMGGTNGRAIKGTIIPVGRKIDLSYVLALLRTDCNEPRVGAERSHKTVAVIQARAGGGLDQNCRAKVMRST